MRSGWIAATVLGGFLVACRTAPDSTSSDALTKKERPQAPAAATSADGGTPGATGAPDGFKPAFTPSMPRMVNTGGPILSHPDIVTVTFANDPNAALFESIGDAIGATDYWRQITSEYGVGPATGGKHVRVPNGFGTMSTDDLANVIAREAADPRSGWPAPTPQTLYVLYPPPSSTVISQGEDACDIEGGEHLTAAVNGKPVPYAIVLQCGDPIDVVTSIVSHEMAEASVDPVATALAWSDIDPDHFAWTLMQGFQTENADMCEFFPEASYTLQEASLNVVVQRQWSSASGAAGHNPCVPAPPEPYFNVTPISTLDDVLVNLNPLIAADLIDLSEGTQKQTKGVRLSASNDATIELGLYSDAPTDAWQIEAYEMDPLTSLSTEQSYMPTTQPTVTLQLDKTSGKNGDKVTLSVHANARAPVGPALVLIKSTLGASTHFMPVLVGSM
jgi:hypothetical protein